MSNSILSIIIIGTLVIALLAMTKTNIREKMLLLCSMIGIFIYCGIGISYDYVDNKFIFYYFVFLAVWALSIRIFIQKKYSVDENIAGQINRFDRIIEEDKIFVTMMAYVYLLSLLLNILTFYGNIDTLFAFDSFSSKTFSTDIIKHSSTLYSLISEISLITLPFFLIYIYELVKSKKIVKGYILIALWIWLDFGQSGYMARYKIVIFLAFLVCYTLIVKYGEIQIKPSLILILGGLAVIALPVFEWISVVRIGGEWSFTSIKTIFDTLVEMECGYPKYYELCFNNAGSLSALDYILWLILLPIPSSIWSGKPGVSINAAFTKMVTGMSYSSQAGYSILLPSIVGESFLTFGKYFFWILPIIVAFIAATFFKFSQKSKKLTFYNVYIVLQLLTIGRGGSQGFLGTVINGSIVFVVWYLIRNKYKFTFNRR